MLKELQKAGVYLERNGDHIFVFKDEGGEVPVLVEDLQELDALSLFFIKSNFDTLLMELVAEERDQRVAAGELD